MTIYDVNGNEIGNAIGDFGRIFNTEEVIYPSGTEIPYTTGTFYAYPYKVWASQPQFVLRFKDANGNWCTGTTPDGGKVGRADIGDVSLRNDTSITLTETGGRTVTHITKEEFDAKKPHGGYTFTWDTQPVTMVFVSSFSKDKAFFEGETDADNKLLKAEINTNDSTGLMEQMNTNTSDFVLPSLTDGDLLELDDSRRKIKSSVIRTINQMRGAIRLGTFNVKGSGGFYKNNWYMLKACCENFGIDICGMQEVSFPLNEPKFKDYFEGWLFPYVSDNGDDYRKGDGAENEGKNERMLLSKFPIDSTEETMLTAQSPSGDVRYVAKSVLSLPRYKDKRGSENLKLSVYNTQLEVISATNAQAQAREILGMAQADENPFVIIMGDTNDFTLTKEVWKIFENGGFTPVIDTNTSTVAGTYDYNCIDGFFLSKRIKSIDWDVIWGQRYPWVNNEMLSDHDLVIADVQLDYSDIRCINTRLTNCTIDYDKGWLTDEETITVNITADNGYTLDTIKVRDCQMVNEEAFTINGNTINIDGSELVGDILITATAVAETAEE